MSHGHFELICALWTVWLMVKVSDLMDEKLSWLSSERRQHLECAWHFNLFLNLVVITIELSLCSTLWSGRGEVFVPCHRWEKKKLFHRSFCSDHQIKYYSKNNRKVLGLFNLYIQWKLKLYPRLPTGHGVSVMYINVCNADSLKFWSTTWLN